MTKAIVTNRALDDLRAIRTYSVEEWGQTTADKYLDAFDAALQRLSEMPALLREEPQIASRLHFYRVHKHFLVCDMIGETIYFLTVIHGSMDLPERLADLQPTLALEVKLLHSKLVDLDDPPA